MVTGHTGFKGSWLAEILLARGSEVFGFALEPETRPALFSQLGLADRMSHFVGDIRNSLVVSKRVLSVRPDVLFHLAAQPLVRRSYESPLTNWSTNVIGTANLLDTLRDLDHPCAAIVVTTDKVYDIGEIGTPYCESDRLGGNDPYSASKACVEILANSYRRSFLRDGFVNLATVRAGNVIGGGDWSKDRLLPDLARAFSEGKILKVRNPSAVRPWQHVLDPLEGYLRLAEALSSENSRSVETSFNFGPEANGQPTVSDLVEECVKHWQGEWEFSNEIHAPYESEWLYLNIDRARKRLGWVPRWDFERAVFETVSWYRHVAMGGDPAEKTRSQIKAFESHP